MGLEAAVEQRRVAALAMLDNGQQAQLGQFFTNARTASLIASFINLDQHAGGVRILDPGAGVGSLSAAIVARIAKERPDLDIEITAVELDDALLPALQSTLEEIRTQNKAKVQMVHGNYLELAATGDSRVAGPFDLVIQNPPYGKLGVRDPDRKNVAACVVDVPNKYAAFWALSIKSLSLGGQCVAIVPRSWANGTYFSHFRKWLVRNMSFDRLHVFDSRNTVFSDTGVLQENVIVAGTKGRTNDVVVVSASTDQHHTVTSKLVPMDAVVQPSDPQQFVRFADGSFIVPEKASFTLSELGIKASTGRVVDFRNRHLISDLPTENAVPFIYQANINPGKVIHPLVGNRVKPQWFTPSEVKAKNLLVPGGHFVLVKRFSAKEERRRIVAGVWEHPGSAAFDNKTNYLHENGAPLQPDLARGLCVWLNSTAIDSYFRTFSGHTQVNAGDLNTLPFPSREDLITLGAAFPADLPNQAEIDNAVTLILGVAA